MGCQGDTTNNALWDADLKEYLAFTRIDTRADPQFGGRREGRSSSKDFINWTRAVQVLHGEKNYESYALTPFQIPAEAGGRAGLYFGLGMFYVRLWSFAPSQRFLIHAFHS